MKILDSIINVAHKYFGTAGNTEDVYRISKARNRDIETGEEDLDDILEDQNLSTTAMDKSDRLFFRAQVKKMLKLVENIPPEIEDVLVNLPEEKLKMLEANLNDSKKEAESKGFVIFDYHTGELTEDGKDILLNSYYTSLGIKSDTAFKKIDKLEHTAEYSKFLSAEYGLTKDQYEALSDEERDIIRKKFLYSTDTGLFQSISKPKSEKITEHIDKIPQFENFLKSEYAIDYEIYKTLTKNEVMIINRKYNFSQSQ